MKNLTGGMDAAIESVFAHINVGLAEVTDELNRLHGETDGGDGGSDSHPLISEQMLDRRFASATPNKRILAQT